MENLNTSSPKSQETQDLIEDDTSINDYNDKISEITSDSNKRYNCQKCGQSFLNKQTLDIHKKTSIKCLRSGDDSSSSESSKLCTYCYKTFASKQMRLYHESKCTTKIINELKNDYNKNISNLEEQIKNLRLIIEEQKQR